MTESISLASIRGLVRYMKAPDRRPEFAQDAENCHVVATAARSIRRGYFFGSSAGNKNWKTNFFVVGISLRLPTRFGGIEDNVNSRPQPSRQHAVRNPKSPVLYSGQCAWGKRFADDGVTLEVDEYEQNVTAVVRHMRDSGYKLRQIVDSLRELGVVGRTGKPIGTTRVFEIIHGARKKPARSTNGNGSSTNGNGSSASQKD